MFDNLMMGFSFLTFNDVVIIFIGIGIGIVIGALPGFNASTGIAILLPVTYYMSPLAAIILLVALYNGAEYGGSITAISIGVPGTAGAVATTFDGYPLAKKGLAGKALTVSLVSGVIGGIFATFCLMFFAATIANFGLKFSSPEYFALALFGLALVSNLSGKNPVKGLIAMTLGLLLATVGVDPQSGYERLAFGHIELWEGVPFIPAMVGMFAMSEVLFMIEDLSLVKKAGKLYSRFPTIEEWKTCISAICRGSIIGTIIGAIPGTGASIATFVAYGEQKRASKRSKLFGTGVYEGVAAPESSNNAVTQGALIPMLALGIPGSASTAMLIGALTMHGIVTGPQLITSEPELIYGLFAAIIIAQGVLLILGYLGTEFWIRALQVPNYYLAPLLFSLGFVGSYATTNSMHGVSTMLVAGIVGYAMRKMGYPMAPIVLGLILGPMVEKSFRRALTVSGGDYSIFLHSPICVILITLALISFLFPYILKILQDRAVKKDDIKA